MTSTLLAACGLVLAASFASQRAAVVDTERSFARGRDALAAGNYDEACRAFEEALDGRADDLRSWTLLARARCGAAEQWVAKGEQAGDDGTTNADKLFGQSEEAARKAVDLDTRSADAWATLGHVLGREGRADEAIATLYHAEQLAAPTAELLLDLADALLAARQFALENQDPAAAQAKLDEAMAALDRAHRTLDVAAEVMRRRAELHAIKQEPELALADYRSAIHTRPGDATLLEAHLALVERTAGFADAIDFYTGLVEVPAFSHWYCSRAHELRGNVELNRAKDYVAAANDYFAAEQDFRESARLDPSLKPAVDAYLPSLRAYRGHALTLAEKFPEAEAALFSAIDLDSKHANALVFLHELQDAMWKKHGGEAMPKDKLDEMRAFASKLATAEPENSQNWNNWGLFARDTAKYEESYLAYRRALALEPRNPQYLNDTALILMYHLNRDLDRARQWLEEAITIAGTGLADDARETAKRKEDETALGDAYGNLVNLLQGSDRKEEAIARLREFEKRLPKRTEVDYWKQKLLPDEWREQQDQKKAEADAKAEAEAAKKKVDEEKAKSEADSEGDGEQ